MALKGLRRLIIKRVHMRFSRSLQWKLVGIFVSITIFLMIIAWLFLVNSVQTIFYNNFKLSIESGFNKWSLTNDKDADLEEIKEDLVVKKNAILTFLVGANRSFAIIDKRTINIEYLSDADYTNNQDTFKNELLKSKNFTAALNDKIRLGDKENLMHLETGKTIFDYARQKGNYILYFRYYSDDWKKAMEKLNEDIVKSSVIAIVLSLFIGYALSKTITIPVVNIMHKAQKLASGEFDQSLEVKSDDEIGKLTRTFNFMAKELKHSMTEISSEKNKIETILKYMTDGIIAFNLDGEVIHANPAAKKMLGLDEINLGFNEFSEKYELGINLEELAFFEAAINKETSVEINNKTIKMYFALFTDEEQRAEGIIAVLQDITEQQKLENMRKEFVANVSHELRTPLTSIKSYTETLLDDGLEDVATAQRFLGVINSEADRMTRLVKDLLQLSRMDSQKMHFKMKVISFNDLVKNAVEKMQIEAKSKGQQLECFTIGEIPEIKADRDRIEQVVINILSNSIKYTPENGRITVYIGKTYSEVYVKVSDTGIGIPESDVDRIFERFYRVDKARSREMGGTGLGLSIAKEIVEAHGGTITVSSEIGKGTDVTVKLPMCN
jgi:two-component system sensor histidine kinase VicK